MMVVACPDCNTRYRVRASEISGEGRQLRCVRCSGAWHFTIPEDAAAGGRESCAPEPPASGAEQKGRDVDYWPEFWWGYSLAAIGILMVGVYVFRNEVARMFPALSGVLEAYAGFLRSLAN